jgi:hypothetical protein
VAVAVAMDWLLLPLRRILLSSDCDGR